jgi:hypothetical protein
MLDDIKLCDAKYHEYIELAKQQTDPNEIRLLKNIAWSWSRLVAQLERYHDKTRQREPEGTDTRPEGSDTT